jgi:hypothetical protein
MLFTECDQDINYEYFQPTSLKFQILSFKLIFVISVVKLVWYVFSPDNNQVVHFLSLCTECPCRVVNIPASYSGDLRFKSLPGDQLF